MSVGSTILKTAGGIGAGAIAAVATGLVVERRVVKERKASAVGAARFTSLSSTPLEVTCSDGVLLHAEVDAKEPYGKDKARHGEPTLIFVHGYALNLHCWYYQREHFRGKYRMVFYDQRSHGRSGQSDREHATIDQLGFDLASVIEQVAPRGPVVLIGHSMGGMSIMALAEQRPDLFNKRVAGVGLIATTAGGLHPSRTISSLIPDRIGDVAGSRLMATLAKAPELVDSARRGSNVGFLAVRRLAFGGEVPPDKVEFVDQMLAGTSINVVAEFFPSFGSLNKFPILKRFSRVPTTILCGTEDRITSIGMSRKMAKQVPSARFVEAEGAGHMVIIEDPTLVNDEIEQLVTRTKK